MAHAAGLWPTIGVIQVANLATQGQTPGHAYAFVVASFIPINSHQRSGGNADCLCAGDSPGL